MNKLQSEDPQINYMAPLKLDFLSQLTPSPGILGKLGKFSRMSSIMQHSGVNAAHEKKSKLNKIANKLKHRQECTKNKFETPNKLTTEKPQKRKLQQWCKLYGVEPGQFEIAQVFERPPKLPAGNPLLKSFLYSLLTVFIGFRPLRRAPSIKRQKISNEVQKHSRYRKCCIHQS